MTCDGGDGDATAVVAAAGDEEDALFSNDEEDSGVDDDGDTDFGEGGDDGAPTPEVSPKKSN